MRRRQFITLLGSAAAMASSHWPLAARAQPNAPMRRIGVLLGGAQDDAETQARFTGFRQALERLGWLEGRNLRLDIRYAQTGGLRQQVLAKELVDLRPDVILSDTTPATAAFQRESRAIPIVFVNVSDPIGSGFVSSLARPDGNITGLLLYEASITGKWLAMLKEIAPHLASVVFIADRTTTPYDYFLLAAETAARSLAIDIVSSPVQTADDIERTIEAIARTPNSGLLVGPSFTNTLHRDLIVALAARHRLPAVYTNRTFVASGGLMSYDPDRISMFRNAATYVDRILRGEKPAALPVQAPVKYETVLNLKTAKALGLTVPDLLLVRADEVIE
jgi:putative ABC transport system substrate-binding protein